LTIRNGLFADV